LAIARGGLSCNADDVSLYSIQHKTHAPRGNTDKEAYTNIFGAQRDAKGFKKTCDNRYTHDDTEHHGTEVQNTKYADQALSRFHHDSAACRLVVEFRRVCG